MTNFEAMIISLTRSNNTWDCLNWEYSGIKDIHPSLEGLSVKEQLKVMRKYHGRYVEWRNKEPGQEWKYIKLVEEPNGNVVCISNFKRGQS